MCIFSTPPRHPPKSLETHFWGQKNFSNFPLKMTFQPRKTGWNRKKIPKKNISKKVLKLDPRPLLYPMKINTFLKVWIWGLPPQWWKNPHFLYFFFLKASLRNKKQQKTKQKLAKKWESLYLTVIESYFNLKIPSIIYTRN